MSGTHRRSGYGRVRYAYDGSILTEEMNLSPILRAGRISVCACFRRTALRTWLTIGPLWVSSWSFFLVAPLFSALVTVLLVSRGELPFGCCAEIATVLFWWSTTACEAHNQPYHHRRIAFIMSVTTYLYTSISGYQVVPWQLVIDPFLKRRYITYKGLRGRLIRYNIIIYKIYKVNNL